MLRLMTRSPIFALCSLSFLVACGAGRSEAESPSDRPPSMGGEPAEAAPELDEPIDPENESEAAPEPEADEEPDRNPRDVRYIVGDAGLRIEVAGARFQPKVEAVKVGGGWGVKVTVKGTSHNGEKHSILAPEDRQLAFAGTVKRAGKAEEFNDERAGEDEVVIDQGQPVTLVRQWPGNIDVKPVANGQTLELEVGLWGLGKSAKTRKPLRKFFVVKMPVAGGRKPKPVLAPPPTD